MTNADAELSHNVMAKAVKATKATRALARGSRAAEVELGQASGVVIRVGVRVTAKVVGAEVGLVAVGAVEEENVVLEVVEEVGEAASTIKVAQAARKVPV